MFASIFTYLETCKPFIYIALIVYPYIGGWGLFSKKQKYERNAHFYFNIEEYSDEKFSLETDLIKWSVSYNSEILLSLEQIELLYYLESEFFSLKKLSERFEPYLEEFVNSLKNDNKYDNVIFIYEWSELNDLFKEKCSMLDFCEFKQT
jgi:hypothetical protein